MTFDGSLDGTVSGVAGLGLLTGLHAASWGAVKDTPFEGFRWRSYLRSVLLGVVAALTVLFATPLGTQQPVVVLAGVLYTVERLTTEWWKTFLRDDDQSAYTIPMRLGRRGTPVDDRVVRYTVGAAVVLLLAAACWAGTDAQPAVERLPSWALILLGGTGGWLTAVGGAWKDAPVEGFSRWKFLRSPAVATAWAWPLSQLTDSWVVLTLASGGFAVASIETYKTFLTGGRPPGKFATKRARFHRPRAHQILAGIHASAWGALAGTLVTRLPEPLSRLGRHDLLATSPALAQTLVAGVSAVAAVLVLASATRVPTARPRLPTVPTVPTVRR